MSEKLRVLIVDDDRMMAKTLYDIIRVKGYEAEVANSGADALKKIEKENFECVLSDIKMPGINGVELYRAIKKRRSDLPVVLMTAYSTDKLVQEGLATGAIACLTKPLDINLILTFLSTLSKERSIVIVDDDFQFCKTLEDILRARSFKVTHFCEPYNIAEKIKENDQVILLDMKLNGINGLDVLKDIRKLSPHLPVILVTGYRDEMNTAITAGLSINAYTCLYKPLQIEKLFQILNKIYFQELGRILGRDHLSKNKGA